MNRESGDLERLGFGGMFWSRCQPNRGYVGILPARLFPGATSEAHTVTGISDAKQYRVALNQW
jgi:hypothetical protein